MTSAREEIIGNCRLILGDCRAILPTLGKVDAVVTDPVWPNAPANSVPGSDRPVALFAEVARDLKCRRAAIQLGCNSDPAMLSAMALPFFRVCWLEYACPSYLGRVLHTGDVAYIYGEPPPPGPGRMVLPGKCVSAKSDSIFIRGTRRLKGKEKGGFNTLGHPMPRRLEFVSWLVNWFTAPDDLTLDPFMGSGTTGVACVKLGRRFIGIEIEEKFFDVACKRIEAATKEPRLPLPEPKPVQQSLLEPRR